jgi:hypothetical protein
MADHHDASLSLTIRASSRRRGPEAAMRPARKDFDRLSDRARRAMREAGAQRDWSVELRAWSIELRTTVAVERGARSIPEQPRRSPTAD